MNWLSDIRIAKEPPKAAPDDTPMICGPTSGLQKNPLQRGTSHGKPCAGKPGNQDAGHTD
jgi:hypothetical protein